MRYDALGSDSTYRIPSLELRYAKTKSCRTTRSTAGSDLQQPAGDEVHQRRDVGRQEVGCRKDFLRRHEADRRQDRRRAAEDFQAAIDNVKPTVEVKSRRVGGSTYQVPIEVHQERRGALAIRWIVSYARGRGEKTMTDRLSARFSTRQQSRQRGEEERRHAPHGGRKQGVCALQVLRAVNRKW